MPLTLTNAEKQAREKLSRVERKRPLYPGRPSGAFVCCLEDCWLRHMNRVLTQRRAMRTFAGYSRKWGLIRATIMKMSPEGRMKANDHRAKPSSAWSYSRSQWQLQFPPTITLLRSSALSLPPCAGRHHSTHSPLWAPPRLPEMHSVGPVICCITLCIVTEC